MSYARRDLSRVTLTVSEPSMAGLRAHERRQGLVSPDRRCFVQSMSQESGRRVGGNAVPNSASGGAMYSYTFPQQREQANPYTQGPAANYYSAQRSMADHSSVGGGRSAASVRNGTPTRRGGAESYEPGTYANARASMSVPMGGYAQPQRSGTPTRGGYVDLERQSTISRR